MINLGDLASFIGGKVGLNDAASLTKIKSYATHRYASIYAGALWKDALTILTKAVAIDQSTIILPAHIAHFVAAKFDSSGLIPIDQSFLFASNPELWSSGGTPTHCSELAPLATKVALATAGSADEIVGVKSSSGADTGKVSLYGEDRYGDPQQEQITLNGTNKVQSANAYAVLYSVSKGATTGNVIVTDNLGVGGTAVYLTLLPAETQRLHRRIRLHSIPGQALTLLILAKRHPGPFAQDTDATNLPTLCDQALEALVHADTLEFMQQYGKAQGKFAEGLKLLADAKKSEAYQAAQNIRMTPGDGIAEGCAEADFIS